MEVSKKDKIMTALKDLAKIALGTDEAKVVDSVESKFMDNKLADGTIIRYDAEVIETGVVVSVVGEDGSVLPLPMGSYVLEDETTFDVVDDAGTADNVVLKETEEVMEEEAGAPAAPAAVEAPKRDAKSIVESIVKETRFKDEAIEADVEVKAEIKAEVAEPTVLVDESFTAVTEAMELRLKKQEDIMEKMMTLIVELSNEGAAAPTETKKNVFKANDTSKKRAKELRNSFREQLGK